MRRVSITSRAAVTATRARAVTLGAICVVVGAGSCTPARSRGNEPIPVHVAPDWTDPVDDYAQPLRTEPVPATAPPPLVIRNAVILTAAGERIDGGTLVVSDGEIRHVGGDGAAVPEGARQIDAAGRYVTPGLIDAHSHLGVYAAPFIEAHQDGNEATAPVTANVSARSAYWPQDPGIARALAGGVTAALILPGSANIVGGRGFTVQMKTGSTADDVAFPGAPDTLKMACGENPKRNHSETMSSRMGVYATFRATFAKAADYGAARARYQRQRATWLAKRARAAKLSEKLEGADERRVEQADAPTPPDRDLVLESLAAALGGELLVQIHCYRASDIREMIAIADELGLRVRAFHHGLEAYKVRELLARKGIAVATWADWWGFKMEAFDGIRENAALITAAGGRAVIKSDSANDIQRLNQEAAKAMYAGRAAGIEITEDQALRWITANPAWVAGIDQITGTLEVGKRADIVLWSAHPFSVYARADVVVRGGEVAYERTRGMTQTDFELGNAAAQEVTP